MMFDVDNNSVPPNIKNLFLYTSSVHTYNTRSSKSFILKIIDLIYRRMLFQEWELDCGMRSHAIWEAFQKILSKEN
jgi:hypothetical protein